MILQRRDPGCRAACPAPAVPVGSTRDCSPSHPCPPASDRPHPRPRRQPCVDDGARPAKAVVDEEFASRPPSSARATTPSTPRVVLTDPTAAEHVQPMTVHQPGPGHLGGHGRRRPPTGWWTYRVEGWSDPYGTWEHDATIKVAGRRRHRADARRRAPCCSSGPATRCPAPPPRRRVLADAVLGLRDTTRPAAVRLKAGTDASVEARARRPPAARAWSPRRPTSPCSSSASWRSSRRLVRVLPAQRGRDLRREGAPLDHRHAPHRRRAAARHRRDGLRRRLPDADPPDRAGGQARAPTTPSTPGPRTPAAPTPSARPTAATTPSTPTSAPSRTSTPSWREPRGSGMEVALDLALQCSPDHPWVTSHPEWFTTRADGTIAYAENPPKKYQDIYPLNFDNDPAGIYAEVRRVVQVWIDHGVTLFRVDNPHTKPVRVLAVADRRRREGPPRGHLPGRGVHPAGDDAHPGQGRLPAVATPTSPGGTRKDDLREYLTELSGEAAAYMRPNFWPTTHDILTPYMQFGGPAAFEAAGGARGHPGADLRHLRRLRAVRARRPARRRGADRQREVRVQGPRLGRYGRRQQGRALPGRLARPGSTTIRRAHPALHRLRDIHFHHVDDENFICLLQAPTGSPDGTEDIVDRRRQPRPARHAGARWRPGHGRAGPGAGTTRFEAHDLLTDERWHLAGATTTCGSARRRTRARRRT